MGVLFAFSVGGPISSSCPNSVWERTCLGNSVSFRVRSQCDANSRSVSAREQFFLVPNPEHLSAGAKQSFTDKCVPKQSLGTRRRGRAGDNLRGIDGEPVS